MRTFIISLVAALMLLTGCVYMMYSSSHQRTFTVVVDYNQSLVEMIQAGEYDWVDTEITAEQFPFFPLQSQGYGRQKVEIALFLFNRPISPGWVINEMDEAGYRPVNPAGLLALGAAQPDLQRQFPIAALGQFWQDPSGYRYVIALFSDNALRGLRRVSLDESDWSKYWRFAAVRK